MPEHNSATPYQCLSVPAPYFAVKTLPLPCESQLFLSMSPLSFAIVSHHNPITMIFCSITLQVKTMTKRRLNAANLCYAIPWHIFSTPTPNKAFPLQIVSMQSQYLSYQCLLQTIQFLCPTEQVHRNLLHFHSIAILCFSEAVQNFSGSGRSFSNTTIFLAIGFPYFASPCRNVTLLHLTPP